eukprot:5279032-Alexandrium_andersonii.AAC.1
MHAGRSPSGCPRQLRAQPDGDGCRLPCDASRVPLPAAAMRGLVDSSCPRQLHAPRAAGELMSAPWLAA